MGSLKLIQTAIILAAGQGKRFKNLNGTRHKSQLKIGDLTFLELSIRKLLSVGITRILVVVGHESELLKEQIPKEINSNIQFVYNSEYKNTGNLVSLIKALQVGPGPTIFLDADIIYETRILGKLLQTEIGNRFVTTTPCGSGDEVLVSSRDTNVNEISKKPSSHMSKYTEYIGIATLTKEACENIRNLNILEVGSYDYEPYINDYMLDKFQFKEMYESSLIWSEVDKEDDWTRIQLWNEQTVKRVIQI